MGKNKVKLKSGKVVQRNLPEVVCSDDLAVMSDEQLVGRATALQVDMVNSGGDPSPWEIELAYIQREQSIREVRSRRHSEYMKSLPPESQFDSVEG